MTLSEAFSEHLVKGQQGQLVIKFSGDVHLCKILVEDGKAVHISHGRLAPELVIDSITSKTVEWANFIAGYPVRKKVDFPLHNNLLSAVNAKMSAPAPQPTATAPTAPATPQPTQVADPDGPTVEADKVAAVIDGFIDLIGPLGTILAEQASATVSYTSGNPMPEKSYNIFVQALAKEVPDDDRNAFIDNFLQ